MKVLVINAGSSSLKYQVIDMDTKEAIAVGNCERIGISGGIVTHKTSTGKKIVENIEFPHHKAALEKVTSLLTSGEGAVLSSLDEIGAVGHRVVQGGETYTQSTLITPPVLQKIEEISYLAPLHNPAQVIAIKACQEMLANTVPHVAVFDTSFHQTMPEHAFIYGIPYKYYEKFGIRRYGAHGTSHRYVSERCALKLNKPSSDLKIITCHLGNGCSITAVDKGISVDTSMGFVPASGVLMGTRCGDIDSSILTFLGEKEGLSYSELNDMMNKESGLFGVSEVSSDARDMEVAAEKGDKKAQLALSIQFYGIKKYIGAYAAAMGGVDAVVFTGGIGENSTLHREEILKNMEFLGIHLDKEKNNTRGGEVEITTPQSTTKAFIIETNEELMIAQDTIRLIPA